MRAERQSLLLAPVPAAETLVDPWRPTWPEEFRRFPAHVTTLGPFLPARHIDEAVYAELEATFAAGSPIAFALAGVRSFPGVVVYLTPEPAYAFGELTSAVWQRWPECPPYGGAFGEVIPHLTVAMRGDEATVAAVTRGLAPQLPLAARADRIELWQQDGVGIWRAAATFPLGD